MSNIVEERTKSVTEAISRMKSMMGPDGPDRARLQEVLARLHALAARPEFWSGFAAPPPGEGQNRYLIAEDLR
jgi:chorismate mutase